MDKSKLNFIIDALMFAAMAAIAGIGFLVKWVLPPGPDRVARFGRNVEMSVFGMDRHQFGAIHLYVAFALLALLVLHVVLHWSQILAIFRRLIPRRGARAAVAGVFTLACVTLLVFPLAVKPDVIEGGGPGEGQGRRAAFTASGPAVFTGPPPVGFTGGPDGEHGAWADDASQGYGPPAGGRGLGLGRGRRRPPPEE